MFGKKQSNNAHDALEARLREMLAFRMTSDSRQEEDDDRPDNRLKPIKGGVTDPTDINIKSHSLRHPHDLDGDRPHSVPHTAREVLADTCVGVIVSSSSAPSTARGEPNHHHNHHQPPPHERSRLGVAATSSKMPPQSSHIERNKNKNKDPVSLSKNNNNKKELAPVIEVSPLKSIPIAAMQSAAGGSHNQQQLAEPPSFFKALQTEYQLKIKRLQEENSKLRKELNDTKKQLKQQHQLLVKERHDKKLRLAKTLLTASVVPDEEDVDHHQNDDKTSEKKTHGGSTLQKLAKVLSPEKQDNNKGGLIKAERVVVVPSSPTKEKK